MKFSDLWTRPDNREAELARSAAASEKADFSEKGIPGLKTFAGNIQESYNKALVWPTCAPLYNRIWRSDPEVGMARQVLNTLSNHIKLGVTIPEYAADGTSETPINDADKQARDFLYTVIDDIGNGSINQWLSDCIARVPFYGWGFWEVSLGIRNPDWRSPGVEQWESRYNDNRVGIRKLAFRSYSSFEKWEIDEKSQVVTGLWQTNPANGQKVLIPKTKGVHIRWGDVDNPEGLATMEALYRLERIKYNLELVMGMGFEHSAGYLDVVAEKNLTKEDKAEIKRAARAIMTAQEGNYALWPSGFKAELKDVPFSVAASLNEAIRYYGILKLALIGLQWAALGTLSPFGSYTTVRDASSFFIMTFNSMVKGFVDQLDTQIAGKIFRYSENASSFSGMTRRPRISIIGEVQKTIPLSEMAQFLSAIDTLVPMGVDDQKSIKRASGFLPETIGEDAKVKEEQQNNFNPNEPNTSQNENNPDSENPTETSNETGEE